jgi:hypothetical protein
MHKYLSLFALGVLAFLGAADCAPGDLEPANSAKANEVRSDSGSCATDQPSVYICQN